MCHVDNRVASNDPRPKSHRSCGTHAHPDRRYAWPFVVIRGINYFPIIMQSNARSSRFDSSRAVASRHVALRRAITATRGRHSQDRDRWWWPSWWWPSLPAGRSREPGEKNKRGKYAGDIARLADVVITVMQLARGADSPPCRATRNHRSRSSVPSSSLLASERSRAAVCLLYPTYMRCRKWFACVRECGLNSKRNDIGARGRSVKQSLGCEGNFADGKTIGTLRQWPLIVM